MRTNSKNKIRFLSSQFVMMVLMVFALLPISNMASAQAPSLAVIGNATGAPAQMNFQELRSVLRGDKQRWNNGTKVVIALMKTSTPVGTTTSKKVYGMSADELDKYWLALVFQGKAKAPVFFNSISELQSFVAQTPGSIGVIDASAVSASNNILVDGKSTF